MKQNNDKRIPLKFPTNWREKGKLKILLIYMGMGINAATFYICTCVWVLCVLCVVTRNCFLHIHIKYSTKMHWNATLKTHTQRTNETRIRTINFEIQPILYSNRLAHRLMLMSVLLLLYEKYTRTLIHAFLFFSFLFYFFCSFIIICRWRKTLLVVKKIITDMQTRENIKAMLWIQKHVYLMALT